jgi:hypothetical protein
VKGGARNRSGPQPDPTSGRSDRRGIKLTALPAEGYDGDAPEYPLPKRSVYDIYFADKQRVKEFDADATEALWERELELWLWAWRTPQACAWAMPSERWRLMAIAQWVRTSVVCESSEATAADKNSLHRFADQIGMTPAGLRENGWAIAQDEVGAKAADRKPAARKSSRDRMTVVSGGAG